MVAVQLLDGETAVQQLGEQLGVPFTGTAMEREVFHPLAFPAQQNPELLSSLKSYSQPVGNQRRIIKKLHV